MVPGEARSPEETQIRVLIGNIAGDLLLHIIQLIHQQNDLLLTGHVQGNLALLASITDEVDVLILGVAELNTPPGICSHLLLEYPHLRIVTLMTSDTECMLYWMGLRQRPLQTCSSTTLVGHIREAYSMNPTV